LNKLRLIKIYELRGEIHPIELSIIELLDNLEIISIDNYNRYTKDGVNYFYYFFNSDEIWLMDILCDKLKNDFKCSLDDTKEIITYLLDKYMDFKIDKIQC